MFEPRLSEAKREFADIRAWVKTNEVTKRLILGATGGGPGSALSAFQSLKRNAPDITSWKIQDHCAAVTRMYAVYERFVRDTLRIWLKTLPAIYPYHSDLPEAIRARHRTGVAKLLPLVGSGRYADITELDLLRGYFEGLSGSASYDLHEETFLVQEGNLRKDAVDSLFSGIGVASIWAWIERNRDVRTLINDVFGGGVSVAAELNLIIRYRNEAAHGDVDEVLGPSDLEDYTLFLETLCIAIAEKLLSTLVDRCLERGLAHLVADVTECYRHGMVVVGVCRRESVTVGDSLVASGTNYCHPIRITSLQLMGVDVNSHIAAQDQEVGFGVSVPLREGSSLYRLLL